jgi:hypothetical protein
VPETCRFGPAAKTEKTAKRLIGRDAIMTVVAILSRSLGFRHSGAVRFVGWLGVDRRPDRRLIGSAL